jgi:hypothetical protein
VGAVDPAGAGGYVQTGGTQPVSTAAGDARQGVSLPTPQQLGPPRILIADIPGNFGVPSATRERHNSQIVFCFVVRCGGRVC